MVAAMMTQAEAEKIAAIVGTADDGCSTCVDALVSQLNEAFPQFAWRRAGDVVEVSSGEWRVGDTIHKPTSADVIEGWHCTEAGAPGKWEYFRKVLSGSDPHQPR